jgi:hypothetical protein
MHEEIRGRAPRIPTATKLLDVAAIMRYMLIQPLAHLELGSLWTLSEEMQEET